MDWIVLLLLPVRSSPDALFSGNLSVLCKCLYNICSELQNLVSIAKVSAPLVFAERKEYNKRRSFGESVKSL